MIAKTTARSATGPLELKVLVPFMRKPSPFDAARVDMANASEDELKHFEGVISRFFMSRTKEEIFEGAIARDILLYPVNNIADITYDTQLEARRFWQDVEYPELGTHIRHPGEFIKSSQGFCGIRFRAPMTGEHNEEIYSKIGVSKQELATLKACNVI